MTLSTRLVAWYQIQQSLGSDRALLTLKGCWTPSYQDPLMHSYLPEVRMRIVPPAATMDHKLLSGLWGGV